MDSEFDVNRFPCDLPWVTSISSYPFVDILAVPRDLLFMKSTNNDLNIFAKDSEIKLVPPSTYIFSDTYSRRLGRNSRVLISFVTPTSAKV